METLFLVCFLFGALFTLVSVLIGAIGSFGHGHDAQLGHHGQIGHDTQLGHDAQLGHVPLTGHSHGPAVDQGTGHVHQAAHHGAGHQMVPIFNVSSLLAFLTWFGAAGYLLTRFAGWPLGVALAGGVAAGALGAVAIALFLGKVLAGEQVMDPRDYRLEGTLARVTVSIPANGAGEIVFTKADARRSEAARSLGGRAVPRDTEVVILDYEHGVATVQPWEEFVARSQAVPLELDSESSQLRSLEPGTEPRSLERGGPPSSGQGGI